MFRDSSAAESAPAVVPCDHPVPLSELALTLPVPSEGWPAFLAAHNVDVVSDDLGRDAVTRAAARMLIAGYHAEEERKALLRQDAERRAVEQDKARRAQLYKGIPWYEIPPGVSPALAMAQAAKDAEPRRVTPTQEWLDQLGGGAAVHSVQSAADE
jgi:hypothetical protein